MELNKVLYNKDQRANTSEEQKARARENIGAQAKLVEGENITIDPSTNTISATNTTYSVFNSSTNGLVPKSSGTDETGKFLKGDGTWATTGKCSNDAELYFYNTDDGDHYHVRNIKNNCVNHVAVNNHSGDICSVLVEAPALAESEEYDYAVVFDCTDSSGFCHVSVENCDAEIVKKPKLDTSTTPNTITFDDVTETLVYFTGSPQFQVDVLGGRWSLHRF